MQTVRHIFNTILTLIFPLRDTGRVVEQATPEALGYLVNPVTLDGGITGLLPYRHPLVRALIIETKFHKNKKATALLADVLNDYLVSFSEDQLPFRKVPYVVVPIPLGAERRKERGYNQTEEVVRGTSFTFDASLLERIRETKQQTSLARKARLENMIGAFHVRKPVQEHVVYIVLDDVTTTGATLQEACKTLREAGAREVYGIALAH